MDLEIDDNPTCYGCGFYSHQYTYKHITINQHQKHLPRIKSTSPEPIGKRMSCMELENKADKDTRSREHLLLHSINTTGSVIQNLGYFC